MTSMIINLKTKKITCKSILCYANGIDRVIVEGHHLRLLMMRQFTKINAALRYGTFTLHPGKGEVTFYS